jgi:type VI secretion system secreted protein Hcp
MAVDMFIKIEGITGESQDKSHAKEIDVLAWSWGMSQSGTFHGGGGGGAGKASVQDLSLTKYIDSASHALQLSCLSGKHISKAKLTVRKAGDKPLEYLIIELEDCLITSVSTGGSGGEDRLTENVTINFAKVHFAYSAQKKEGGGEAALEYEWNVQKNSMS